MKIKKRNSFKMQKQLMKMEKQDDEPNSSNGNGDVSRLNGQNGTESGADQVNSKKVTNGHGNANGSKISNGISFAASKSNTVSLKLTFLISIKY